jgi:hypothetical protein
MNLFKNKKNYFFLIFALLIVFMCLVLTCSSCENFTTGQLSGSDLSYRMGHGLKVSWENKNMNKKNDNVENTLNTNVGGQVPLPDGELFMFYKNKFDDACCPSTYTNSLGCACISKEQSNYLNERGGNRTLTSEY